MTQLIFYASKDGELEPAATDKEFLLVHTEGGHEASGHVASDHFRGVTKLIVCGKRWASDRFATRRVENPIVAACKATAGKSSAVQSEVSDHFRDATKMVVYGKVRPTVYVAWIRRFSTQCVENLDEVAA